MNGKKLTLLVILLLILDQALKIWVKTHMTLGEAIILIPDWFQLYFIENKGAAFGMHIATPGTMDWGKLLLGLFRIGMVVALIWLIRHFMRKKAPKGVLIGFGLILAGAIGNIIDSAFYGLIFSASDPVTRNVAVIFPEGGGYAPFLHGAVVDMFYFPLWQGRFPDWMPVWGGEPFEFFRPVFNIADAAITISRDRPRTSIS